MKSAILDYCHHGLNSSGQNSRPGMLECVGDDVFSDSELLEEPATSVNSSRSLDILGSSVNERNCACNRLPNMSLNWCLISTGRYSIIANGKSVNICLQDLTVTFLNYISGGEPAQILEVS